MTATQIKGQLFNFYFITKRFYDYDNLNTNTLWFQKQMVYNSTAKEIEDRDEIFINKGRMESQFQNL